VAIFPELRLKFPFPAAVDAADLGTESSNVHGAKTLVHRAAIGALYVEHGARVFRFLRDLLGDAVLAADATQETFTRAFRVLHTVEPGRSVVPWLFGIARNVSLELRRARFRAGRVLVPEGEFAREVSAANASPERALLDREAVAVVERSLERLSEDRRAMLLLRLDHGLSYEEIAKLMGFSLAKVKVEIFRAREVLREAMAEYASDVGDSR
jgi:RNA polymerase sigma-70 factor (ECF subfamily)